MRRRRARFAVLLSALALALAGSAQIATASKPPKPTKPPATASVTISAAPNPVVYGSRTTIVGQATGKKNTGATVTLFAKSAPAYTSVSTVATTRTDATGRYTFTIAPDRNTIYYVNVHTAPTATSGQVLVKVRVKITLRVSNLRPAAGARVRFSGFVMPAYNGRVVLIQRKTPRGWRTVARAKLGPATSITTALGATTRSHYAKRVRIASSGRYRVRFNPADALRIANNSPVRRLLVR